MDSGDIAAAKLLMQRMREDWLRNKDFSINWIASLLSFIGRRMGEDAVEEALRDFGDRFIAPRRAGSADIPARKRAEAIARAMKANGADVTFDEEADRFVMSFRCGSGGMLIDTGAYAAPKDYLTLRARGPVTFGRDELPVYCAHCSVNNEIQPIEWDGAPATIEFPPAGPGERCVHHVYKDRDAIPEEIYDRAGKRKPR
jgi:hypothetical protein